MIINQMCEDCVFQNKCVAKNKLKPFSDEARNDLGVELIFNYCREFQDINEGVEDEEESKD